VRLYLEIAETVKPDLHHQAWGQKKEGAGKMSVTLNTRHYDRGWKKNWVQGTDGGIREIVAAIVPAISAYFAEQARQRAEEAERRRIEHEKWLKEEEVRKQKLHEQTLIDTAERRATDFLHAVECGRPSSNGRSRGSNYPLEPRPLLAVFPNGYRGKARARGIRRFFHVDGAYNAARAWPLCYAQGIGGAPHGVGVAYR